MLEVDDIEVRYGQAIAVAGVSLRVAPGRWVAVIAPNGAATTSLLPAPARLVPPALARLEELHAGGLAIRQVEQNAREVLRRAGHAYVMSAGKMVLDGAAAEVARDPRVVKSYVG